MFGRRRYDAFNWGSRIKNMLWTVAGDHDIDVSIGGAGSFTDTKKVQLADVEVLQKAGVDLKQAQDVNIFAAAHEGSHMVNSDVSALRDLIRRNNDGTIDMDVIKGLAQITEDYRVDMVMTEERPGYWYLREHTLSGIARMFGEKRSGNVKFDESKAISCLTHGLDMQTEYPESWDDGVLNWERIRNVNRDIMEKTEGLKTSADAMTLVEWLYGKYYEEEGGSEVDEEEEEGEGGEELGKGTPGDGDAEGEVDEDGEMPDDKITGGAGDGGEGDGMKGKTPLTPEEVDKMADDMLAKSPIEDLLDKEGKKKLETASAMVNEDKSREYSLDDMKSDDESDAKKSYSGKEKWSTEEKARINRELCIGIHAGTTILYTALDKYKHSQKIARAEFTMLDGQARLLAKRIRDDMMAAKNEHGYVSDNGLVIPNQCWKPGYTGDNRVFHKSEYDNEGGYVLDLLIDASGSQSGRRSKIARQAYIIARACSLAHIPCRVSEFHTPNSVTIIDCLRDYDDPQAADEHCGHFYIGADNRDGLALMGAYEELKKRQEPNKILIILSDGLPEDSSGGRVVEHSGGVEDYGSWKSSDGRVSGIDDTAYTIRNIRKQGVEVMGIYVGGDYALEREKRQFGNDFAYIRSMEGFVPTVSSYLHKQIMKMQG